MRKLNVVLVVLLATSVPVTLAQADPDILAPEVVREAQHRHGRLGSILNNVVVAYQRDVDAATARDGEPRTRTARLAVQEAASRAAVQRAPMSRGASVAVTLRINDPKKVDAVVRFLKENGGDPRNVGEDYIEAYVPVALLVEASEQPGVTRVRAIIPPQPKRGPITSQGVTAHGAEPWHVLGFTGKGVKVGVIDTGFANFRALMGTELPDSVAARCYPDMGMHTASLSDCENGEVHGTAVAEALIDIAPDATLYVSDPLTDGDLASAVKWMADQGVRVINYSVGDPWDGPGDGTSPYSESPLNTVDMAVARGIVWVSAAGNEGQSAWFGRFQDRNGNGLHEFPYNGQLSDFNCFRATATPVQVQLRWQGEWPSDGSLADLDLYLHRSHDLDPPLESSTESHASPEAIIPFEGLYHSANSGDSLCISVQRSRTSIGPDPDWIQLIVSKGGALEIPTPYGSIGNPAESANPGLLAVGAAPWYRTNMIESYSSLGPTPDERIKPDIVGVDMAVSSTTPNGFPGTSQASPHVAGLAALVRQAYPNFSPDEVTSYLKEHAQPRTSHGYLPHPNNIWGYGLAQLPPITARQNARIPNDGSAYRIPLLHYFPTSDALTNFSARSSNPGLVTVSVHRGILLITSAPGGLGEATITVTAWFADATTATVEVVVTVESEEALVWPRPLSGWRLALYEEVSTTTSSTTPFRNAFVP